MGFSKMYLKQHLLLSVVGFLSVLAIGGVAVAMEPIEITVWGLGEGEGMIGWLAASQEFERNYNANHEQPIRIVTSTQGGRMNPQKLMCAIAGNEPPDVINQDRLSIGGWAARDAFIPLDPFIQQDAATNAPHAVRAEDYYSACWSEAAYGGKVYAIPNSTDDRALYYNKDLLKAAGYVDSSGEARPPQNWDELKEYAIKLTKKNERGDLERVGFIPNYGNSWLYLYGWQNGGRFMSPDGLTCTLNDPRIVEALDWMTSVYDVLGGRAVVDGFISTFQGGILDPFLNGKVAMKVDGNWQLGNIARYKPDLNFGVVAAPVPQGEPITWSGGFSYAIPRGTQHPEISWQFIRWMTSPDAVVLMNRVVQKYNKSRGRPFVPGISANVRANERIYQEFVESNPDINANLRQYFRLFIDLMPSSRFRPVTPVGQLLWDEHARAFERGTFHEYTAQEALDIGTRAVQKELDRVFRKKTYPPMQWRYPIALLVVAIGTASVIASLRFRKQGRQTNRMSIGEGVAGYLFASPWIIGFIVFTAGPILVSIVLSFCEYDVLHTANFVGLDNYKLMLTNDPLFWKSLWNTVFMILGVPLGMILGLAIAMLLNTEVRGIAVYRTIFYLPAIVPVVASSILWIWIFNPQAGLLNSFLRVLHLEVPLDSLLKWLGTEGLLWLQDKHLAKPSIILMGLWGAGASMIIWLAGLKGIPEHLYEAAEIDGANRWRKFLNVTIPMLSPYIFFNLIMGVIGTFQIFTQAYIMTQGGPVDATMFYVYYLFNNAFQYFKMGYASAMAWILFLIILILTLIQFKLAPRWVHYETEQK